MTQTTKLTTGTHTTQTTKTTWKATINKTSQTTQFDSKLPGPSIIQPVQENETNQIQMAPKTKTTLIPKKTLIVKITKTTREKTKMEQNYKMIRQHKNKMRGQKDKETTFRPQT